MLSLFFVLSLATGIFSAAVPKPCCIKHQLSATIHQVMGSYDYQKNKPLTTELTMKVHFDYDAKMLRLDFGGGSSTIDDYNKGEHFDLKGTFCNKRNLTTSEVLIPPCIPANATYRGRHTIGDDIDYEVDTWFYSLPNMGNLTLSVLAHDCVPVMQGISRSNSKEISQFSQFFHDVSQDPIMTSTFQIPNSCN